MAFTASKIQQAQEVAQAAAAQSNPQLLDANYFGFVVGANEIMLALLVAFASILGWHALKTQRARPDFNLIDLILGDDGKINPEKFIVMVAFSLHSWTILKWIITGIVSTADFVSYGTIWVAPLIVSIIKSKGKEKPA
jgi:hypothetical protein